MPTKKEKQEEQEHPTQLPPDENESWENPTDPPIEPGREEPTLPDRDIPWERPSES